MALDIGYIAYLKRGAAIMRLDDSGQFELTDGFAPPATQETPLFAIGTSANRYEGSTKVTERATDVEFILPVVVNGRSEAQVRLNNQRLAAFLKSGTKDEPVYFCYLGNDDVPFAPVWGQYGAPARYEIIHAFTPQVDEFYHVGDTRQHWTQSDSSLRVKPYIRGQQQRYGSAIGGILHDVIGTEDGRSRGLIIPEATTNKMTNPVFGHSTWNNGWTAGANLIVSENRDKAFRLPGTRSSAKLTAIAATTNTFSQSIAAGNTNTHILSCYVRLPDGGAVSTTQIQALFGGATANPTFTHLGNGWYRIAYSGATSAGAATYGVVVKNKYTVYVAGFQLEEKSYTTPLCWGDLMGCAWSGTANDSTSTRTAARWQVDIAHDTFSRAEGTVRVVWKPAQASTSGTGDRFLWATDSVGFQATYSPSSSLFSFTDAVNTANSGTETFAAGDIIILHYVFGPSGIKIYRAGAEIATNSTYTPPPFPSVVYLGGNGNAQHNRGTILDFSIYDRVMSATEIAADYTNINKHVTGDDALGVRLSSIPWLWTKDGDNQVDNCNDSTRNNWAVIGGVPGNAATPFVTLAATYPASMSEARTFWLDNLAVADFINPTDNKFYDMSGAADTGVCGGEVTITGVGTAEILIGNAQVARPDLLRGRAITVLARLKDAATAAQIKYRQTSGNDNLDTEFKHLVTDGTYRLYEIKPSIFSTPGVIFEPNAIREVLGGASTSVRLRAKRASGSANISLDYFALLFDAMKLVDTIGNNFSILYENGRAITSSSTSLPFNFDGNRVQVGGKKLVLQPDKWNIISWYAGDNTTAPAITRTFTYKGVWVTPLWGVH